MIKKLLVGGTVALVGAFIGALIEQMAHQWDENVADYNSLLEKCNEMSDFIDSCDFYEYKDPKATDKTNRYSTEEQTMSDGTKFKIKHDAATGFSVLSCEEA